MPNPSPETAEARPRRSDARLPWVLLFLVAGPACGVPLREEPKTAPGPPVAARESVEEELPPPDGVFHVVRPGQTLWRIARAYGTTVETLAAANGLARADRIEVGAAIFVPGATRALDVPPWPAPPPEPPPRAEGPAEAPIAASGYSWPVVGELLSAFGQRRRSHVHLGLDIRGKAGEEVLAARSGRVVFVGTQSGYGRTVVIDHGDGDQTLYAHNSENQVAVGDWVERGDPIARVGSSGNATTPHVHFEVRRSGEPIDPAPLLRDTYEARK